MSLDYLFFVEGVAALLLTVSCWRLARAKTSAVLPWPWMAVFSSSGAGFMWLSAAAAGFPESAPERILRGALLASALVGLFEFGRRSLVGERKSGLGRWSGFVLLAVAISLGRRDLVVFEAAVRTFVGFPATLMAGWALWRAESQAGSPRNGLRLAAGAAVFFGASSLVLSVATVLSSAPVDWLVFLAHAARTAATGLCAAGVWWYWRGVLEPGEKDSLFVEWVMPVMLFLLLCVGGLGAGWLAEISDLQQRETILRRAAGVARTVDVADAQALVFAEADKDGPQYRQLSRQMADYARFSDLRRIYCMAVRDGRVVFGPESLPAGDQLLSPPGTVCEKPDPALLDFFKTPRPLVFGPYSNEHGLFVTGLAPVWDHGANHILMAVGVDCPAEQWKRHNSGARLGAILPAMFLAALLTCGMEILRWHKNRASNWLMRNREACFTVVFGSAMSFFVFLGVRQVEKWGFTQELRRDLDVRTEVLAASLRDKMDDLSALSRFCTRGEKVTKREFEMFAGPLARRSGVTWEWVAAVAGAEREDFERAARIEAAPDFRIFDMDPVAGRMPAAQREAHYPVTYITPLEGNEAALGYDNAGNPVRRQALEACASAGLSTASDPVVLVQEPEGKKSTLVYEPVFVSDSHRLRGFAAGIIRPQSELVRSVDKATLEKSGLEISLWDLSDRRKFEKVAWLPEKTRGDPGGDANHAGMHSEIVPIFAFGRAWAIVAGPSPEFWLAHKPWVGLAVGLMGLLLTGGLTTLVVFQSRYRTNLENQVMARTLELRESEAVQRNLMEGLPIGLVIIDPQTRRIEKVNAQAASMFGAPARKIVGQSCNKFLCPSLEKSCPICDFGRRIDSSERELVRADGAIVPIFKTVKYIQVSGRDRLLECFIDISEQKRAERALHESEESYRRQFQENSAVMLLIEPDGGVILDANKAAVHFYGYTREGLLAKNMAEIRQTALDSKPSQSGAIPGTEGGSNAWARHRVADGTVRDVEEFNSRIRIGQRDVVHAIIVDVGERKRAEEALRRSYQASEFLHKAIIALNACANIDAALACIMEKMVELGGMDCGAAYAFEGHEIVLRHQLGLPLSYVEKAARRSLSLDYVRAAMARPLEMIDLSAEFPDQRKLGEQFGLKHLLCIALVAERQPFGLLTLASRQPEPPGTLQIELMRILAKEAESLFRRLGVEKKLLQVTKQQRVILEASAVGICFIKNRIVQWANATFDSLLGFPSGGTFGFDTSAFYTSRLDYERVGAEYREQFSKGGSYSTEVEMKRQDGEVFWCNLMGRAVNRHSVADGSIWIFTDITPRKRAEAAMLAGEQRLRRLNERFNLAADSAEIGVWEWEVPENRLIWDRRMMALYNVEEQDAPKTYEAWAGTFHPEDGERVASEVQHAVAGEKPLSTEFRILWRSGAVRHICAFARVERDQSGRAIRMTGVNYDVTKRKLAEVELQNKNRELAETTERANRMAVEAQQASAAKSAFLANMSHEIRTPMNAVIGMTKLLLDTNLDKKQKHFAETVNSNAESLLQLLSDILDFSKIEAGRLELEDTEFDLVQMITSFAAGPACQAALKGLLFSCRIDADTPVCLRGDPTRLRQILVNLASNAIKFTARGEVTVQVTVIQERESSVILRFSVTDTGIGIPPNKRSLLFQTFSQVDSSMTRKYGGTGLGLAISKQLALLMGGEIGVESEEGRGSEFWFTVRLKKSATTHRQAAVPSGGEAMPEQTGQSGLERARILLTEDVPTNQEVALGLLNALGCENVEVANNGSEAVAALATKTYDLVFMDVQMPVMDGLTAVRQIRDPNSPVKNHRVPVIAMTAHAMQGDREKCMEAGMDDYITKPLMPDALVEVLNKWVRHEATVPLHKGTTSPGIRVENVPPVFDRSTFMKRMLGNAELAANVADGFVKETLGFINELEQHLRAGDLKKAVVVAHGIAGSAANINGEAFSRLARTLEDAGKNGDRECMAAHIPELRRQFGRLAKVLKKELLQAKAGTDEDF